MSTTDPFADAARAEAERRHVPLDRPTAITEQCAVQGFQDGAEWARTHLTAQEPTEDDAYAAQVETKRHQPDYVKPGVIRCHCGAPGFWSTSDAHTQHALWHALRAAARRDEEKRDG